MEVARSWATAPRPRMEREFIDVNERYFITVTSAMDYRPWVPYENVMLSLTPSCGTTTTTNSQMTILLGRSVEKAFSQ